MQVSDTVNLGSLSTGGRLIAKAISNKQGLLKGIISGLSSRAVQDQYTDVAFVSSSGRGYDLLLIQQRYPETNDTKSVDGRTIFGFSCTLSPSVDTEVLAWDLHQAEATFEWGDPGFDGTVYTQDNQNHALYVQDPDGRIIELKPGLVTDASSPFIKRLDSVTLHVSSPEISSSFYSEDLGLQIDYDSGKTIPGKRFIWLKNSSGERLILLYVQIHPDGNPVKSGGYGLDHVALSGLRLKEKKDYTAINIRMDPDKISEKTDSAYIQDPDGYWIESYYT